MLKSGDTFDIAPALADQLDLRTIREVAGEYVGAGRTSLSWVALLPDGTVTRAPRALDGPVPAASSHDRPRDAARAQALTGALRTLDARRTSARRTLAAARNPARQARAARTLAAAYATARCAADRARTADRGPLLPPLRRAEVAYRHLAVAALGRESAAYGNATSAVQRADRELATALRQPNG